MPTANSALAIWWSDEYILSFLFATQLRFRQIYKCIQSDASASFQKHFRHHTPYAATFHLLNNRNSKG